MERTPVKVRGKNRPRPPPSSGKRRPGRPWTRVFEMTPGLKPSQILNSLPSKWKTDMPWPPSATPTEDSQGDTQDDTQGSRKRRRTSRHRKLSLLESLPAEVLQQIFLDSMNVDLPLTSPALLHKLNSEHIKMRFAIRALYWPSEQDRADTTNTELPDLQDRLLARRFFTWDFYRRYARKAFDMYGSWPWLEAQESGPNIDDVKADAGFQALDYFALHVDRIEEIDPFLRFHDKTTFPEKLLKGPWGGEKHMFFRFLFVHNFPLDHEKSSSAETLILSLTSLARSGANFEIAQWLVCMAISEKIPLPQNLLRRAVIDGGCHEELVENILTWSLYGKTEYFDPPLWNWAAANGEKGKWLIDKLKATATEKEAADEAEAAAEQT